MTTATLVAIVTTLVRLWRTKLVRERVFGWIGKTPAWAQWLLPLVLGFLTTGAESIISGAPFEQALNLAAQQGGEVGMLAIAVWHIAKRVLPLLRVRKVVNSVVAASIVFLWSCVGTLEESRPSISLGAPSTKRASSKDEICREISRTETLYGAGAVTFGALSGASGLAAIPVKDDRAELALSVGVVTFAAAAVGLERLEAGEARDYTREGCAQ